MNINFTIGLNVLEFLCHFGAMACYISVGTLKDEDNDILDSAFYLFVLFLGITLTTIGANS